MTIKKAIILAGGFGTRLDPVTLEIPKPLIPIRGKTLTEHVITHLKSFGIEEFYLSVAHMKDTIIEYCGDGSRFGVEIHYIIENDPRGTAGPLLILKEQQKQFKEDFLMVNCDNLFAIDFQKMLDVHKRNGAVATIALTEVDDPSSFGVVDMEGDRILAWIEKPIPGSEPSNLINSGYYILSPKIFDEVKGQKCMMEINVFPHLAKHGGLFGYPDPGQFFDTGTFERWKTVINEWKHT